MMNIGMLRLYVGQSGKIGEYNVQEIGLAKEIVKQKNDVNVYIFFLKKELNKVAMKEIEKSIYLVYLPCWKVSTHGIFKLNLLKQFNLDVLHILADTQIYSGKVMKWCFNNNVQPICIFGTIKSSSNNKLVKSFINIVFSYNKRYLQKVINVAKTPSVFKELKNKNIKELKLIPVGLDKSILTNNIKCNREELRKELFLPIKKKILLFVGRLSEYKKPLFALKMFNELLKKDPEYFIVIIGNGELRGQVLDYINQNSLTMNVKYIDKINNNDIWQYYYVCDLFINTNDQEIFGMSILEAIYYKCPVMAIDAPGPRFILKDGQGGYLIQKYNIDEWISNIENMNMLRNDIITNAKQTVDNEFCWDKISAQYLKLYEKDKF